MNEDSEAQRGYGLTLGVTESSPFSSDDVSDQSSKKDKQVYKQIYYKADKERK